MANEPENRFCPLLATDEEFDLPREEERILSFWLERKIFEHSVSEREKSNRFVFFEGPPTANGKPGIHHVIARAFKDAIPRYQTMRGKRVERRAGWDTHGLPVELEVEKQLGISGKLEIENLVPGDSHASIAKFNELCRQSVWTYKAEFERLTSRMGFWIDLDDAYITYSNEYIESVWWILRQLWNKDLLYQDFKVVPYCPRCGTALSSHEVAQGYAETTDQSVYVKFRVVGQPTTFLIAWTTTPWTLPGNVALAVGPKISYGRYTNPASGETYILADARKEIVLGDEPYERHDIAVDELTTLEYEPLFAVKPLQSERSYRVYPAPFVTTGDGSGIVHTAAMYGEDDFTLSTEVGLPKFHTVGEDGRFTNDVPPLAGRFVKDVETESMIIALLEEYGALLKTPQGHTHTYPFCWRCKTPLLYYARSSWFIRISQLREQLLAANDQIMWVPEHLRDGRFGEWLREVKDWALSRQRYWGTPLPIWQCSDCRHQVCIGSLDELQRIAGTVPDDLHKPMIDDVEWHCSECQHGTLRRFSEVIDVWFDSGSMPFAQWHYPFDDRSEARVDGGENYPADYIAEAIDQTRGWFYTLLAIATALGRETPYRRVVSMAHVLDKDGKKMSKSLGNVIDPIEAMTTLGADPIRFFFYSVNQPGDTKRFNPDDVVTVTRKVFLILWNTYRFLATRSAAVGWKPAEVAPHTKHVLDAWLVSRTGEMTQLVTDALEQLDLFTASRTLEKYINQLSTWYLRLNRKRTDKGFLPTLYWALRQVALLIAPLTPFFADGLWQRLRLDDDPTSVHLANWPKPSDVDRQCLDAMRKVMDLVELGRAARAEAGLKLRQPLRRATIVGASFTPEHETLLLEELNVRAIKQKAGDALAVELDTELDDTLRAEGLARALVRAIQSLRKAAKLEPGQTAIVFISGTHELIGALMGMASEIERLTRVTIDWHERESQFMAEVEGLTIHLLE